MIVIAALALVVAWSISDGTSMSLEVRRRLGMLGYLGPAFRNQTGPLVGDLIVVVRRRARERRE